MCDHRRSLVASKVARHARERLLITRHCIGERSVLFHVRFDDSRLSFQLRMRETVSFQQVSALEAFRTDVADKRATSMIVLLGLLSLAFNDGCSPTSFLFGYFNENTHRWSPTTLRENIFITVPQFRYS